MSKKNIRKPWNCLTRYVLFQVESYTIIIKNIAFSQRFFPILEYSTRLIYIDRSLNCTITVGSHLKHPFILPKKGHVTELVICHHHQKVAHQGRGMTHNHIRSSGFWIIGGRSAVASHISKCVKCRKFRGSLQEQKMADLPEDRLDPTPPFTYSAVDFFGPWLIEEGRRQVKRYSVLFTCLASRAIHLETANSLDTSSFLNAYRRFIGHRGPVRYLRSDQSTNFVGCKNELKEALSEMNQEVIKLKLLEERCDWIDFRMNVPHVCTSCV